ncbi:MAG: DoxX family protein [Gemmobacter sp.]
MSDTDTTARQSLIIPALRPVYAGLETISETLLRVAAGVALVVHGWPKIQNPTGSSGVFETMGLGPAGLLSVLLAAVEFFGGILLILGLLTRPAAAAALIVLLGTVWFHWVTLGQGYGGAELSILWSAMLFFFAVRGGNAHSVDARIGKAF